VVDGDTFYCRDGRKVRLIGVDSPEMAQGSPGRAARDGLRRMLHAGRAARLESDLTPTDRYGRVLAWVWAGGTLVNEAMVRQGWAMLYTVPPNVKYVERLERAQKKARAERAGLWNGTTFECPPSRFRRRECLVGESAKP
jgi:micrococcal nuclease